MENMFRELCSAPRPAGSERIKQVRDYIISLLRKGSYTIEQKSYPFTGWELLEKPTFSFTMPIRKAVECIPVVWSGSTEKEVVGRIAPAYNAIKTFEAYPWQIYGVVDDKNEVIANLMTRPDMVWAQPLDDCTDRIPHLILDIEACKLINTWIVDKKDIEIAMCVKSRYIPNREVTNIISYSNDIKSKIIISTHYDSMFNTVGAHDNASGTVALLKLEEFFSKTNMEYLKFILFDAEEWNKYCSYCYVDELKKSDLLKRIKLVINIDSVGVGDHIYLLTSPSIEADIKKTVSTLETSSEIEIDISSREAFQQFDSWPFMRNGIPVVQIGTRGTPNFAYFHHPNDNINNINYSLMDKVVSFLKSFIKALLEEGLVTGG